MSFAFPPGYGYCFAVLGASCSMNFYLMVNVVMARKKYDIQYPALYAPAGHKYEKEFNSVQRAHQNTLESLGPVMLQMMACGLKHPITAATCGALYVLGRVIYGYGYAKGGPEGRMAGGIITHLGDWPLMFMCCKIGYDMIMTD